MPLQSHFHSLALGRLPAPPHLPDIRRGADPADPARSVLTDLRHAPVIVADHLDGLDATAELLHKAAVHMALVADVRGEIVGLVTSEQLRGERPMQRAAAAHVAMEELTLEDLMTPRADWAVIDAAELDHARVGDIVATMEAVGQRYLFVVESAAGVPTLVGLFSARRIEAGLRRSIVAEGPAHSFAELELRLGGR